RVAVTQSYFWPDLQLNLWTLIMLATGGVLIGIYSTFLVQQQHLGLGVPWIMPFGITVGALTVLYIIILLALISQGRLLPGVVILGAFILFVLYLTGLIETAIQLFGPGRVLDACNKYVENQQAKGLSINTLAWLEQDSICSEWEAVFAFWIIGTLFLLWMLFMAAMVARSSRGGN
ncbi:hypothetical protein K470DRAFT_205342, partial [Piedraia hortae CBS 480.64]